MLALPFLEWGVPLPRGVVDCLGQYRVDVGVLLVAAAFTGLTKDAAAPEETSGLEAPNVCTDGLEMTRGLTGWEGVLPGNCFLGVRHLYKRLIKVQRKDRSVCTEKCKKNTPDGT